MGTIDGEKDHVPAPVGSVIIRSRLRSPCITAIIEAMSPDVKHGEEKHIGRRAFLGMVAAGILALFVGKDIFPRFTTGGSSDTTTAGGGSDGGAGGGSGGGSPTAGFRINSIERGPLSDTNTWRLTIDGLVGAPLTLSFADFLALPQTTLVRDFYCVEGWGVNGVEWVGVTVKELMQRIQIDRKATHLVFHSGDGVYTDSLTLEEASAPDVILAQQVNGISLPPDMGRPLRLITPGRYAYKCVKWVERMEAVDEEETSTVGYWEARGYSADALIP